MDTVILAGGLGTRLKEVVSDVPKPLAPIDGKPFLDILLSQLSGIADQIILAIGYKGNQVKKEYPFLVFSEEKIPLGTGGALKKAMMLAQSSDVIVLNGDSYFEIDFKAMERFHREKEADLTIACRNVEDISRYGSIDCDSSQRIVGFREKIPSVEPGLINGGIYIIKRHLLTSFPDVFSLEEEGFPALLKKCVYAYPSSGKFIDIGTKESYFHAKEMLCEKF